MRFSLAGVGAPLDEAIGAALREAGHERGDPPELVVVGVDVGVGEELLDVSSEQWLGTIATLRQAFARIRQVAREMSDGGGRIVVVVPVHAIRPSLGCGRAAIVGSFMTTVAQVAAVELAPQGVTVNTLAVGPLEGSAPAAAAVGVPRGRLVTPEEVGRACALLAADGASALTGALIPVDAGYSVTKAVGGSPFTHAAGG